MFTWLDADPGCLKCHLKEFITEQGSSYNLEIVLDLQREAEDKYFSAFLGPLSWHYTLGLILFIVFWHIQCQMLSKLSS